MIKKALILTVVVLTIGFIVFQFLQPNTLKFDENVISPESTNDNDKKILAGKLSPFLEYTKQEFEKAKLENKIIFLDFYATWCPICRVEAPEIDAGFNSLNTDRIVGFRVNFNDPDTDSDEKQIAKDLAIPYQHTKVILKDGIEFSRSSETWEKEDFLDAINSALK